MFKILLIVKIYCLDKSTQVYTLYVAIKFVLAIEEFCMRLWESTLIKKYIDKSNIQH